MISLVGPSAFLESLVRRRAALQYRTRTPGRAGIASVNRRGRWRPGYEIVTAAVLRSIPGADGLWYDGDRQEIVLSIAGQAQPFSNLSAGQRMMAALVADVATKAVMQTLISCRRRERMTPKGRPCCGKPQVWSSLTSSTCTCIRGGDDEWFVT